MTRTTDKVTHWLLDGDPAIRWQVLRDLVGSAEGTVERARQKLARGVGSRLLELQDPEGTWAGGLSSDGGLYSPKWTSTDLHDAAAPRLRSCRPPTEKRERPAKSFSIKRLQRDGGINYGIWGNLGRSETCITGMILSILAVFRA